MRGKVGECAPADAGHPGVYVTVVAWQPRDAALDEPMLRLLLCEGRSELAVKYTLRR